MFYLVRRSREEKRREEKRREEKRREDGGETGRKIKGGVRSASLPKKQTRLDPQIYFLLPP
jgi:hypothetical protein